MKQLIHCVWRLLTPSVNQALAHLSLKRWLLLAALSAVFWVSAPAAANSLHASVNTNSLTPSDTLQLTVQYLAATRDIPDFSSLNQDFDILNTSTMSNRSIVNGQYSVQTSWVLLLAPKRAGTLLIPSLNLGGAISDAIPIEVSAAPATNAAHPVTFESFVDTQSVHLQQQILLTLRLKINASFALSSGSLEPLTIKDAVVVAFDEQRSEINEGGVRYDLREYQYAIFPQTSGELIIPSQLLQLELSSNRWSNRDWLGQNAGRVQRFRTQEQRIKVAAAPADARATPWLPAQSLSISQHFSGATDAMQVGDPITRTITLSAEGLTGAQLPSLPVIQLEHLNAYQDQAQIDDQKDRGRIKGSRIETTALVATRAGDYTLPGITVNWWNTAAQAFASASLDPVTLKVNAKFGAAPDSMDFAPHSSAAAPATPSAAAPAAVPLWGWGLLLVSGLLNVALITQWLLTRRAHTRARLNQQQAAHQHQALRAQDERDAWHALRQAFKNPSADSLRRRLLDWSSARIGGAPLTRLEQIAQLIDDPQAKQQLQLIDAALFGKGDLGLLDVDSLEAACKRLRQTGAGNNREPAPLYPD